MRKTQLALVAAICAVASCQVANATMTYSYSDGGGALPGSLRFNFDAVSGGTASGVPSGSVGVSFTGGGGVVTGDNPGFWAAPYLSGNNGAGFGNTGVPGDDATPYLTAGGVKNVDSATLTFAPGQTYLGILWGSLDSYNTLTFFNGGTAFASVTGQQVSDHVVIGDQGFGGTHYVNFLFTGGETFDKVVATSDGYAFEFDNVAIVPEPTTVLAGALLLLPFGVSTIRSLRRKA